jgi:hypothetical protein
MRIVVTRSDYFENRNLLISSPLRERPGEGERIINGITLIPFAALRAGSNLLPSIEQGLPGIFILRGEYCKILMTDSRAGGNPVEG